MSASNTHVGVLIIGDEILSGRRKDKHLDKAIEILKQHNLVLSWARYAGDDEPMLVQHFREIRATGHVCFSFGGIGATVDDRTRQSIAKAFDRELIRHPDAKNEIESRFGDEAYPNRILMADLPAGSDIIPNPYNRIPGFSVESIYCLPGFPVMAWPMMKWVLDTKYEKLPEAETVLNTILLQNVHESDLIELLEQTQKDFPQIKISCLPTLPKNGPRIIELGVQGVAPKVDEALDCIRSRLSEAGLLHGNIT